MVRERPYWAQSATLLVANPRTTDLRFTPVRVQTRVAGRRWTDVELRPDGCFVIPECPDDAHPEFRLVSGRLEFLSVGARGRLVSLAELPRSDDLRVRLPSGDNDWQANRVSSQVSLDLLEQSGRTARGTQKRLTLTFTLYTMMLSTMFLVGLGGFVAALISGFGDATVGQTVLFGGLSAVSFLSFFLSKPAEAMAVLGARTAWMLAMVNTYWTKMAYLNDPKKMVAGLNEAETGLRQGVLEYLARADRFGAPGDETGSDRAERPEEPGATAGGESAEGGQAASAATSTVGASGALATVDRTTRRQGGSKAAVA